MALLTASHIFKHYAQHTALNDVSFEVPENCIFGLLGPNGAGKTSFIRIVNQITAADSGEMRFLGERLQPKHIADMGYLPEERGLYKKMQVGEQLLYLARLKGISRSDARRRLRYWIERFDIEAWWKKNIEDLSKGMQQKVQFIATVLHEPKLLILDEPFSGFDPINANLIKEEILQLAKRGATIIFSTHRMESVEELCDHIVMLNRSRKVLDGPKEAIKERFRTNTFLLQLSQPLEGLPHGFEMLERQEASCNYRIRIQEGDANGLLQAVMAQGAIVHGLQEQIPSMNEIFIRVAQEEG